MITQFLTAALLAVSLNGSLKPSSPLGSSNDSVSEASSTLVGSWMEDYFGSYSISYTTNVNPVNNTYGNEAIECGGYIYDSGGVSDSGLASQPKWFTFGNGMGFVQNHVYTISFEAKAIQRADTFCFGFASTDGTYERHLASPKSGYNLNDYSFQSFDFHLTKPATSFFIGVYSYGLTCSVFPNTVRIDNGAHAYAGSMNVSTPLYSVQNFPIYADEYGTGLNSAEVYEDDKIYIGTDLIRFHVATFDTELKLKFGEDLTNAIGNIVINGGVEEVYQNTEGDEDLEISYNPTNSLRSGSLSFTLSQGSYYLVNQTFVNCHLQVFTEEEHPLPLWFDSSTRLAAYTYYVVSDDGYFFKTDGSALDFGFDTSSATILYNVPIDGRHPYAGEILISVVIPLENLDITYTAVSPSLEVINDLYGDGYDEAKTLYENTNQFAWLRSIWSGMATFFAIEVLPNISLGFLAFAPLLVVAILAIVRIIKHD